MHKFLNKIIFIILGVILLIFFSKFIIVPSLFKVGPEFEYSVDLISIDNFYNKEKLRFGGEQRSVSTFGLHVKNIEDGVILLNNIFNVRTVSGQQIINLTRTYGINQKSWKHQQGFGDKDRGGYLFAPRHLSVGIPIEYWHVNYDKKLILEYDGEDVINGLKTYRYKSDFTIDQTDDLGHLPGVPEEMGINLDSHVTVWFEPVSGWMVKFSDNSIAYFYDNDTGERLYPWNNFSNNFSQSSVIKEAQIANKLKTKIYFFEYAVPIIIGLLLILIFSIKNRNKKVSALLLALIALFVYLFFSNTLIEIKKEPIKIGISKWVPEGNSVYEDNIRGFKDALSFSGYVEGDNVEYLIETAGSDPEKQRDIANKFIKEDVDLIYSLTTPGTLILKDLIPNKPIVFSIVTYPVEAGIVASLNKSGNNLVGTRNWVPVINQLINFRDIFPAGSSIGFVKRANELNSNIQYKKMLEAAKLFGIEIIKIEAEDVDGLKIALENSKNNIDSLYSSCDTLVQGEAEDVIIGFIKENKIPSFSCNASGVFKGDLIGTVSDYYILGKISGDKAALILEGASPESLLTDSVFLPHIHINQGAANLLGLKIPQSVYSKARIIIR